MLKNKLYNFTEVEYQKNGIGYFVKCQIYELICLRIWEVWLCYQAYS